MSDEQTPETPTTETGTTDQQPQTPETGAGEQGGEIISVDQLPAWAQKELTEARKDAAKYRTSAQAKDQERQALLDDFAVRLGLKSDEKTDPEVLTKQLTAAQQAQKDAAIQLAVYKAAGQHQGNPDALLDSKTFLANVSALDTTSSDFPTQVSEAVKAAVTQNNSLRLVQATGSSAADHAGGSGETGLITEQQVASATPEQIDKWFSAGRLNHLLRT